MFFKSTGEGEMYPLPRELPSCLQFLLEAGKENIKMRNQFPCSSTNTRGEPEGCGTLINKHKEQCGLSGNKPMSEVL